MARRTALAVLCAFSPAAVAAQEIDCAAPATQLEMTACAARGWQAADAELNRAYGVAIDRARAMDAGLAPEQEPAEEMLREAQRAWIPFRDKACAAESLVARGGSMQPMLVYLCLERLTRQRSADLERFGTLE